MECFLIKNLIKYYKIQKSKTSQLAMLKVNDVNIITNMLPYQSFIVYHIYKSVEIWLGLSIKDVRSQWGGELSSADILRIRGEGVFKCGRSHFLVQKTSDFLKFMVYPHGQGG